MEDYDPSEFRVTADRIAAAWVAAALIVIGVTVAMSFAQSAVF